jgi:hypothetical protein
MQGYYGRTTIRCHNYRDPLDHRWTDRTIQRFCCCGLSGILGVGLGAVLIIVGLVDLALGVGCFMAWPWVWTVGVIFTVIGLLISIASLFTSRAGAIISIIIAVVILYYLFQPHVKAYFGKS